MFMEFIIVKRVEYYGIKKWKLQIVLTIKLSCNKNVY